MRNRHVFRPTAFDSLEDRVVMATGPAMVGGQAFTDNFLVQNEVNSAFSRFSNDLFSGFNSVTNFQDSPTTPNALVGPSLALFQTNANERVSLLAEELSNAISPLRGSTRTLIPSMLTLVGRGNGSLANTVSTTINQLTTAVNATQGPNTTPQQNAAIQQANADIEMLRRQLFAQVESARVAVGNQVRLFSSTPRGGQGQGQGRGAGGRARFDINSAQNAVSPAYNAFQSGLTAAIGAIPTTPTTNTSFQNDLNNLRLQTLNLANTLNSQLSSLSGSNRARTYLRTEANGLSSTSLLNDINEMIEQLGSQGLPSAPGTLSLSAFNFGISNIIAQSRLETAGLLAVGSA